MDIFKKYGLHEITLKPEDAEREIAYIERVMNGDDEAAKERLRKTAKFTNECETELKKREGLRGSVS